MLKPLTIQTRVDRLDPRVPRFMIVPAKAVEPWGLTVTTTVEVSVNGIDIGRRSLTPWGDGLKWSISLNEPQCRKVGVDTGDKVTLTLRPASEELPAELAELLAGDTAARGRWEGMTEAQRRMLREEVGAGKQPATRMRRARKWLTK
jgi:hypothetical protein